MQELGNRRELEGSSGVQVKDTGVQGIDLRLDPQNDGKLTCKGYGQRVNHSEGEYLGGDGKGMFH